MRSSCQMILVAASLFLPAALAQAGGRPTLIPLYSGSDGSRACIEISRSGERSKAVPVLEIPWETARQMAPDEEAGSGLPAPSAGDESENGKGKNNIGRFLMRHRSLLVREGPEGVSLGNGFDLVGDIQEALEKRRRTRERPDSFVSTRENATRR